MASRTRPKPVEVENLFDPAAEMTQKIIGKGIENTLPTAHVVRQTAKRSNPPKKINLGAKPAPGKFQPPKRGTPAYRNFRALPAARQRALLHLGRPKGWSGGVTGTTSPMTDAGSGRGTAPKMVANLERLVAKKIKKVHL